MNTNSNVNKIRAFAKIDLFHQEDEIGVNTQRPNINIADTDLLGLDWTFENQNREDSTIPKGYYILKSSPSEFLRGMKLRCMLTFQNSDVNGKTNVALRRAMIIDNVLNETPYVLIQIKTTRDGEDFNGLEAWLNLEIVEHQQLLSLADQDMNPENNL